MNCYFPVSSHADILTPSRTGYRVGKTVLCTTSSPESCRREKCRPAAILNARSPEDEVALCKGQKNPLRRDPGGWGGEVRLKDVSFSNAKAKQPQTAVHSLFF